MREITYKFENCIHGSYSNISMSGDHLYAV